MPGRRGLFVRKDSVAGTSPQDARLALAGLLTPAGDLGVAAGVISGCAATGTTGWTYNVAAGHVVGTRGASDGAAVFSIDGTTATPTVAAAPASGSRWDLIWARQRDVDSGDADATVEVGVTSGTSGGSPSKPYGSVPAGAVVLAEAQVSAGATQTAHASVTITQAAARVAARGGIVPVPNTAGRAAAAGAASPSAAAPLYVHRGDAPAGRELERTIDGTNWATIGGPSFLQVRQVTAADRSGGIYTQAPVTPPGGSAPAVVTAVGYQPWTHANGIITITESGVYRIEVTASMAAATFAVAIRRSSDNRILGQSATGASSSFTNQAVATSWLDAGDTVYGLVFAVTTLNLRADSPSTPCTLSIARL